MTKIANYLIGALIAGCLCFAAGEAQADCPPDLWKGLIAESARGNLEEYRTIASIVRNRLDRDMDHGLVALRRKKIPRITHVQVNGRKIKKLVYVSLDTFVDRELAYARTKKGGNKDLEKTAKTAAGEDRDYANGATHYEHTGVYPVPRWAKKMKVVKVLFPGTKDEITCWKKA